MNIFDEKTTLEPIHVNTKFFLCDNVKRNAISEKKGEYIVYSYHDWKTSAFGKWWKFKYLLEFVAYFCYYLWVLWR